MAYAALIWPYYAIIGNQFPKAQAVLAFVIQMDGVTEVRPNIGTHPEFGEAMEEAKKAGVEVLFFTCHVEPGKLAINYHQNGGNASAKSEL